MEWNALREQWQRSAAEDAPDIGRLERGLWHRVRRRDGLETLVAGVLALVFGAGAWRAMASARWLESGFALLLVAVVVYIPFRLWRARRAIPDADPARPVRDYLDQARDAALAQAAMMRSVAWWYSGPIAVGVIGFVGARRDFDRYWLAYAAIVVVFTIVINWLNARAADRVFDAAARDIERQIRNLEDMQ